MLQKILVVTSKSEDADLFEDYLAQYVEKGAELLVSRDRKMALELLHSKHPQLLFLDRALLGPKEEEWLGSHTHIVLVQEGSDVDGPSEDFLVRPLVEEHVVAKCEASLKNLVPPSVPPM